MSPPDAGPRPLTLTTSESLARVLRRDYALAQKRAGHTAWEVPPIHGLQRWCRDQWLQTWPDSQLLHGVQELALWQRAIAADGATSAVLSQSALAREARAMGRLVMQYQIEVTQASRYTDEHHAFAGWHQVVREEIREHGWILECELPGHVASLIRSGDIPVPPALVLQGSTALTPLEQQLLQTLEQSGCSISRPATARQQPVVSAQRFASDDLQFRALAETLREILGSGQDAAETTPVILVACPDPQARRAELESALKPWLAPWLLLPGEGQRPLPWRFSRGRGLDQQPLIAVALCVCGLQVTGNTLDELSRLLLASVLWTPAQRELCAQADYALRELGGTQFPLKLLARLVPEPLGMRFQSLLDCVRAEPRRALPSQWVAHFTQRLEVLGWPGERTLPSALFQAREQWTLALATFSAMDRQIGSLTQAAALGWLREITTSKPFEPRADHDQPILILTPAEAADLPADHLFLLDASDDKLPGPARRYPLLATETLVKAGVPDVTAASMLAAATSLTLRLQAQTSHLHLSYAELDERGAQRQPSPLFGHDRVWMKPAEPLFQTTAERAASQALLEWPAQDPIPPVQDPAAEGIFGGTRIFKDFVEAPFFAFCKYRLGIEPLPQAPAGIPPSAQGLILHAVLEQAWRELRTQDELKRRSDSALGELLDPSLDQAMQRHLPPDRFGQVLRGMERARLRDVLLQWLAHERRREESFEVLQCEHAVQLRFEGLDLRLVIDRVDRVNTAQGERFLILDYKTGREAETRGWKADRLQEPQLPLYATSAALGELGITRVDGIALAHLKDGHPALAAATNWSMGLIESRRRFAVDSWPQQLAAWRGALTLIARGFLAGEAGLESPRKYRFSFNRDLLDLVRVRT